MVGCFSLSSEAGSGLRDSWSWADPSQSLVPFINPVRGKMQSTPGWALPCSTVSLIRRHLPPFISSLQAAGITKRNVAPQDVTQPFMWAPKITMRTGMWLTGQNLKHTYMALHIVNAYTSVLLPPSSSSLYNQHDSSIVYYSFPAVCAHVNMYVLPIPEKAIHATALTNASGKSKLFSISFHLNIYGIALHFSWHSASQSSPYLPLSTNLPLSRPINTPTCHVLLTPGPI